jgi:hypothetical protein
VTGRISVLSSLTVESSKLRVKLTYSPHKVGGGPGSCLAAILVPVGFASSGSISVWTIVLNPLLEVIVVGFRSSKDGNEVNPDGGVNRAVLVVNGRLVQSGPVSDGYVPVQYDTVVVMLGFGKTKLKEASP